jgi:hypothetical protein
MSERTLHIYYRHVHVKADKFSRDPNKARPHWFSHERCFNNLIRTIAADPMGGRVRLTVVYDGSLEDFQDDFMAGYYAANDKLINIQFIQGGSDKNSFLITNAMAKTADIPPTDIVYFLENDYVHQHGWVSKVLRLFDSGIAFDYLSLYDHADKYMTDMYPDLACRLVHTHDQHWRTTPSSCASYMLEKRTLDRDYPVFTSGLTDYYFFSELIGRQGHVMLSPVPGLSTHSMSGYLSPAVDWEALVE